MSLRAILASSQNKVPVKARETMMLQPSATACADLDLLRSMIASSPIRLRPRTLAARLADWEHTRRAPDIDVVILDWIVSHVHQAKASRRLHA